jgi:hypothetical protein
MASGRLAASAALIRHQHRAGPQQHLQSKSEKRLQHCFDSFHFDGRQYFESGNPATLSQLTTQIALLLGIPEEAGEPDVDIYQ